MTSYQGAILWVMSRRRDEWLTAAEVAAAVRSFQRDTGPDWDVSGRAVSNGLQALARNGKILRGVGASVWVYRFPVQP